MPTITHEPNWPLNTQPHDAEFYMESLRDELPQWFDGALVELLGARGFACIKSEPFDSSALEQHTNRRTPLDITSESGTTYRVLLSSHENGNNFYGRVTHIVHGGRERELPGELLVPVLIFKHGGDSSQMVVRFRTVEHV